MGSSSAHFRRHVFHVACAEALRDLACDYIHTKTDAQPSPTAVVNMKFESELPGVGSHNWYYAHFPHRTEIVARSCAHALYIRGIDGVRRGLLHRRARRFIDSYQVVLANSEFTRKHIRIRWSVDATTLYPPCSQISGVPATERTKTILNVGRFQANGPNSPYKAQDVLIETFAQLPELSDEGWSLHLIGAVGTNPQIWRTTTVFAGWSLDWPSTSTRTRPTICCWKLGPCTCVLARSGVWH